MDIIAKRCRCYCIHVSVSVVVVVVCINESVDSLNLYMHWNEHTRVSPSTYKHNSYRVYIFTIHLYRDIDIITPFFPFCHFFASNPVANLSISFPICLFAIVFEIATTIMYHMKLNMLLIKFSETFIEHFSFLSVPFSVL